MDYLSFAYVRAMKKGNKDPLSLRAQPSFAKASEGEASKR